MKKKEIEEEKKEALTSAINPFWFDSTWLLVLLSLGLFDIPKSDNKTTINIYTGSDK